MAAQVERFALQGADIAAAERIAAAVVGKADTVAALRVAGIAVAAPVGKSGMVAAWACFADMFGAPVPRIGTRTLFRSLNRTPPYLRFEFHSSGKT